MPGPHSFARREQAAIELARGRSIREVATIVDVHERTVRRWLAEDADFASRVRDLQLDLTDRTIALLGEARLAAISEAIRLLKSTSEAIRIRAAGLLMDHGARAARTRDEDDAGLGQLDRYLRDLGTRTGEP